MPISSGAAGRVAVGADMAIAWTPDGVKETKLHNNRSNDSYLKRYLESTQRQGSDSTGDTRPPPCDGDGEDDGTTEKCGGTDGESSEKLPSGKSLKKSKACTLL